jgi:hypothetical protein
MRGIINGVCVLFVLCCSAFIFSCDSGGGGDGGSDVTIDGDDIGGRVTGSPGEAGVWVIAETDEVLTLNGGTGIFRKIVVTNEDGNFVIPDLPDATYDVWVRGYGLVDSAPVQVTPGNIVNLQAVHADTPQEAAEVYPANYWYSLLEPPPTSDFPGTGEVGNGIPESVGSQAAWVSTTKLGCELCHQIGNEHTREHTTPAEWDALLQLAGTMNGTSFGLGRDVAISVFSDWATRIAAGEVPPEPPRPAGIERNIVISQWEWGDQFTYAHDEIATDKRDPFLYPYGPVYGVDIGNDWLMMTDPVTHTSSRVKVPTVGGHDTPWCDQPGFCTWVVYDNPANPHNPMMDDTGKVWMTTQIRAEGLENLPDFCLDDPFITSFGHHRQLGYYDTLTSEFVLIDTCFGTHHLQFDSDGVLWLSGDSFVAGTFFDPSLFDPSDPGTVAEAQGWSPTFVDTDGDGIGDTQTFGFHYGVIPNPTDGTIWTAVLAAFPSRLERYDPATDTHEAFSPPSPGNGPRGVDVDTQGNIWTCLGGSGHVAKFDRTKCAQTWGTGDQCPEGWTMWETPGPQMKGVPDGPNAGSADFHYYVWVDQFNTLGMGEDIVICTGTGSDSLLAFDQDTEEFTVVRVPYPLGFFQRGLDGRIDDPDAGWKGRGLWVDYGNDPIKHTETGKGQVCQVQLRPDPLAH